MPVAIATLLERAGALLAARPDEAARLADEVVARQPRNLPALRLLADARVRLGDYAGAATALGRACRLRPGDARLHVALGRVHYTAGDIDAAIDATGRAVRLDADCPDALANWLGMRLQRGEFASALPELAAAFDARPRDVGIAMAFGEFAIRLGRVDDAIERLRAHLATGQVDAADRGIILHRLALLLEHAGRHTEAFAAAREAKALRPQRWDADEYDRRVDRIIATFSREALAALPRNPARSDLPVLVVGVFRSGTSLTEQILASHSAVFGAGEAPLLGQLAGTPLRLALAAGPGRVAPVLTADVIARAGDEYCRRLAALAPAALRITDKHPLNVELLGIAALALPGARVIHCVRDPLDTCLSAYFTNFRPGLEFANDLTSLGRYYRAYERLMAHWRAVIDLPVHELRYEALVADPDARIRALVNHLGLPFEAGCLEFHATARTALTPSNQQVREPMYQRSVGRHARYGALLDELRAALGS